MNPRASHNHYSIALALYLVWFVPPPAFAQVEESGPATEEVLDDTRHVEESEESYRQRMELRDQRYRDQQRVTTVQAAPSSSAKIDQLPPASRAHMKAQLRDMIIESRLWKPGEESADYPYQISPDAREKPALARQERAAWSEELEKYQQREAAAFSGESGAAGTQGQAGIQGQSQAAGNPGQENRKSTEQDAAQESESASQAAQNRQSGSESSDENQNTPPAGVSESALDFLQSRGDVAARGTMNSGAPTPGGVDTDGNPKKSNASVESGESQRELHANAANEGSTSDSASQNDSSEAATKQDAEADATAAAESWAGTIPLVELRNLDGYMAGTTAQQQNTSAPMVIDLGTLKIDDLDNLDTTPDG